MKKRRGRGRRSSRAAVLRGRWISLSLSVSLSLALALVLFFASAWGSGKWLIYPPAAQLHSRQIRPARDGGRWAWENERTKVSGAGRDGGIEGRRRRRSGHDHFPPAARHGACVGVERASIGGRQEDIGKWAACGGAAAFQPAFSRPSSCVVPPHGGARWAGGRFTRVRFPPPPAPGRDPRGVLAPRGLVGFTTHRVAHTYISISILIHGGVQEMPGSRTRRNWPEVLSRRVSLVRLSSACRHPRD